MYDDVDNAGARATLIPAQREILINMGLIESPCLKQRTVPYERDAVTVSALSGAGYFVLRTATMITATIHTIRRT